MLVLVPLDMSKNEIRNALIHVLAADPASPVEGQVYYNSTDKTFRFYSGAAWRPLGRLDQIAVPAASVNLNSQNIVNLLDPVAAQDGATKNYVDNLSQGLSWKNAVLVATTANGALATAYAAGQTVDGRVLSAGDRILIKNQTAGAENGVYTVNSSGAPTRATDANSGTELLSATVMVGEGTANADTLWTQTTGGAIVVGTTALVWVQIGAGAAYSAGAGLTLTGNVLAVGAGTGITVNADDVALTVPVSVANGGTGTTFIGTNGAVVTGGTGVPTAVGGTTGQSLIATTGGMPAFGAVPLATPGAVSGALPVANGGTGATTAQAARTNLGVPSRFAFSVGNGVATSFVVNHAMGNVDVMVEVYRVLDGATVLCDVVRTDANNVTLTFAVAPTASQYRCIVIG